MLKQKGVRTLFKIFTSNFVFVIVLIICGCANPLISYKSSKSNDKPEIVVEQQRFKVSQKTASAYNAALKHMRTKNYETAIAEMEKVARMDKRISGPWVNIGLAHKELGDLKKARISFEKALAINPNNPYALNYMGILYRENGEFEKAEKLYKQALSVRPDYQNAHLNLGILCDLYLRKIDCAVEHYQQYLNLTGKQDKQVTAWMAQLKKQGS